jgi:predicted ATP-binding protein involved in virulence
MRIDRLEVTNFKKFAQASFEFPRSIDAPPDSGSVHVLIGENGSGKTSVLDALAVAMGIWLHRIPDSSLNNSRRPLFAHERRLVWVQGNDREFFMEDHGDTSVKVTGRIGDEEDLEWGQLLSEASTPPIVTGRSATKTVQQFYDRSRLGQSVLFPIIAYYQAGRVWTPSDTVRDPVERNGQNRWSAFRDCLSAKMHGRELNDWFLGETLASAKRNGKPRPGFEIVKHAVKCLVPGADEVWFDSDRREIVLSLDGEAQPFSNLSAGQRALLAIVVDIAIRMITQNNYLVPTDTPESDDEALPRVLAETPGVVLIDEIDVHLHPRWQRTIIDSLRSLFPKIQFIATTHSPFIVQSLREGELVMLDSGQPVAEPGKLGVEAIAEGLMGVQRADVGTRYAQMVDVAKDYLGMLAEAAQAPDSAKPVIESLLRDKIAPYADNPAFQAYLEMERVAALGASANGEHSATGGE